jgi:DNA-binding NtrC family response regulator
LILAGQGDIQPAHFGAESKEKGKLAEPHSPVSTLGASERQIILEALKRNRGNKAQTARELGVSLSTIKRRAKEFGFDSGTDPESGND